MSVKENDFAIRVVGGQDAMEPIPWQVRYAVDHS